MFGEVRMFFPRFFTLVGLIFKTVDALENCTWSQRSKIVVSKCPMTTDDKQFAENIKKCDALAGYQNCSESSLFKYHCVLIEADTFLEVCAPEVKLFAGQCATFNISNGRIEPQLNRTCYTGGKNPCPLQYMSSELYRYPTCYGLQDNLSTYKNVTERSNIDTCLEEELKNRMIRVVAVVFGLLSLSIIIANLFCCRDRILLCLRTCIGCKANTNSSAEVIQGYDPVLKKNRDFTMKAALELVDIAKENTSREERDTLLPKGNLHQLTKQTSSLCITNIGSIHHISHISNGKIWLSNRKHIMEINRNGRILNNFDIDDAPGSASHTIDRDGDLLFFMDDIVLRAHSNGKITTFLKQTGKVLSIYYSRITDEIILGTYEMLGNKVNSKLSRYNKKGNLIYVTEFYKGKRLYVLPMFITENINGDICTSDSGTLMVKGVDKFGNLIFNYDGKQTQTEFYPTGICNDAFGHVLVCNRHHTNPSIHVLDLQGIFLSVILTAKDGIKDPYGLCVSDDGCLYLGQYDCNTLLVYRYLDED